MTEVDSGAFADPFSSDSFVQTYERWADPDSRRFGEALLERLTPPAGDGLLDVGTGLGALAIPAAEMGLRVTAIDTSALMIEECARRLSTWPECRTAAMDSHALALEDDSFDVAASLFSVTFQPDAAASVAEMTRVVRPGGTVALVNWASPTHAPLFPIALRALERLQLGDSHPVTFPVPPIFLTPDSIGDLLRGAGVQDVIVEPLECEGVVPQGPSFLDELEPFLAAIPAFRDLSDADRDRLRPLLAEEVVRQSEPGSPGRVRMHANLAVGHVISSAAD